MKVNLHPTDPQWESNVRQYYGDAYPELETIFQQILGRAFMKSYWIPDPIAMDYLCKIMIRFMPVTMGKNLIEEGLSLCTVDSSTPQNTIRFYESVGEMILWWTSVYHERDYQIYGQRMFSMAYEYLQDEESSTESIILMPGQEEENGNSPRMRVNKLFSEQFDNFLEVMERSDLINDPAYSKIRNQFLDDDFTIH